MANLLGVQLCWPGARRLGLTANCADERESETPRMHTGNTTNSSATPRNTMLLKLFSGVRCALEVGPKAAVGKHAISIGLPCVFLEASRRSDCAVRSQACKQLGCTWVPLVLLADLRINGGASPSVESTGCAQCHPEGLCAMPPGQVLVIAAGHTSPLGRGCERFSAAAKSSGASTHVVSSSLDTMLSSSESGRAAESNLSMDRLR